MAADLEDLSGSSGLHETRRLQIRGTMLVYAEAGTHATGARMVRRTGGTDGGRPAELREGPGRYETS